MASTGGSGDIHSRVLRAEEIERGSIRATVLLRGMESYTVLPGELADDRGKCLAVRRLFALQEEHPWPGSAFSPASWCRPTT